MNRDALNSYIEDTYGAKAEYLWASAHTFAVYRHSIGAKWFAVIMDIDKAKIGLTEEGKVSVVNLKCDPLLIGSVTRENGIHRGYHMNKNYWITVRLDGSVSEEQIKWLLGLSFDLTAKKIKTKLK
ncbi:MAG: MmcQ/YjbR family DNA-binding protein [Clostridia bacterium]|nr:MmcQ/YjbR family DNA-binding protein [Clostridia bacterium]